MPMCVCRNSTHSHVVRLLRGSGTRPTLVVSSVQSTRSLGSGRSVGSLGPRAPGIKKNSQAFRDKVSKSHTGTTVLHEINNVHLLLMGILFNK